MKAIDKVFGKQPTKSKPLTSDDLPRLHHEMMKEYGWIPIELFKKIPLGTFWNLLTLISEDRRREQKEYKKMKKK